jgi:hypothetical protein
MGFFSRLKLMWNNLQAMNEWQANSQQRQQSGASLDLDNLLDGISEQSQLRHQHHAANVSNARLNRSQTERAL